MQRHLPKIHCLNGYARNYTDFSQNYLPELMKVFDQCFGRKNRQEEGTGTGSGNRMYELRGGSKPEPGKRYELRRQRKFTSASAWGGDEAKAIDGSNMRSNIDLNAEQHDHSPDQCIESAGQEKLGPNVPLDEEDQVEESMDCDDGLSQK